MADEWINKHPRQMDVGEENFISYYKQLLAFVYFNTGDDRISTARGIFPPHVLPTEEQFVKIYNVIDEINENAAGGVGLSATIDMMKSTNWTEVLENDEKCFDGKNGRFNTFRRQFERDPSPVIRICTAINPALDLQFIFSTYTYTGDFEYLNTRRVKLRKHLVAKIAILADLLYMGQIHGKRLEEVGSNTEWCKQRISLVFTPKEKAFKMYGKVELNEWPINQLINLTQHKAPSSNPEANFDKMAVE